MKAAGLSAQRCYDAPSETEAVLIDAQVNRYTDYANPISGHAMGAFQTPDGRRILITSEPSAPLAAKVNWDWLKGVIGDLLGTEQVYFFAWLKVARESLRKRDFRPGQCLCFIGKPDCGKSYLQWCITHILGGRSEDPLLWLRGGTTFNAELCEAEHWKIDDPGSVSRGDVRRDFGDAIKRAVINRDVSIHGKNAKGITLSVWRRLTISCNWENTTALPIIDESNGDKIMLFNCGQAKLHSDIGRNQSQFFKELPGLLRFLDNFEIPKNLISNRMGVVSHHNPEVLAELSSLAPELQLLELIDEVIFDGEASAVRYGSEKLKQELLKSNFRFAAEKLLYYSSACGVLLQRLAVKFPNRVSFNKSDGRTLWTLYPSTPLPVEKAKIKQSALDLNVPAR